MLWCGLSNAGEFHAHPPGRWLPVPALVVLLATGAPPLAASEPAGAAGAIPRAHPGQRPAGPQRRGPRQPDRRGAGLVPRRLEGRSAGPLGLRAPVRAPDVQEHGAHAGRADRPADRGCRRQQQRLHRRRHHQLLRGRAEQLPADAAVGRGRAPVQPQRRRRPTSSPSARWCRRNTGRACWPIPTASCSTAIDPHSYAVHPYQRPTIGSIEDLDAASLRGRDRLPRDVLPARQRDPDRRRRLRPEAARCLGRPVFRLDPEAGRADPAGRPRPNRRAAKTSATPKPARPRRCRRWR